MKFGIFITLLFLILESSLYFVLGETAEEESDCTKLYNFLYNDDKIYFNNCCNNDSRIKCDHNGNITSFSSEKNSVSSKQLALQDFPYLSKLEYLNLTGFSILNEIPDSISKLTNLKSLDLSENFIEVIPSSIGDLSELENLNLAKNNILYLPTEMFKLINLKTLDLSKNAIKEIPSDIQNLIALNELNLSDNKIKKMPKEAFKLPNLIILHLYNNEISPLDIDKGNNIDKESNSYKESNSNNSINNQNITLYVVCLIVLGGIIILLIALLAFLKLFNRNKSKQNREIAVVRTIEELPAKKEKDNSNINNTNENQIPNKLKKEFLFQNILND